MAKGKARLEEPLAPLQMCWVRPHQFPILSLSWSSEDVIHVFSNGLALSLGFL